MVAKILGLATGTLAAAVGVWVFNDWRNVSDEDRLMSALRDHCLPYVSTGVTPFDGMGRSIGVYDNADIDDRISGGGSAIIYDARFVATWGEISEPSLRVCRLDGRPMGAFLQAFDIESDGFIGRVTDMVQPFHDLQPDTETLNTAADANELFQTVGWYEDQRRLEDFRVVMSVVEGQVANVIVVNELERDR